MNIDTIKAAIEDVGLAYRGAFHPTEAEDPPRLPDGAWARTIVLAGFGGGGRWPAFAASGEAQDDEPNALDRWSERVVSALAADLGAAPLFPFGGPPWLPFLRWARRAEPVYPSPVGMLVHPDWGLWHSYRGALAFADAIDLPPKDDRPSPCESCGEKPCLTACPVGAFTSGGYDVPTCKTHIWKSEGQDCMDFGCRVRRACPVGAESRYGPGQAAFHMRAFRGARE